MLAGSQSQRGSGNVQIVGNNNCVNNAIAESYCPPLTHSVIHDLLNIVYEMPSSNDGGYSLARPAQMHDKLRFNKAARYRLIIDNHADDYARVDEVMKGYPDSETIVKKLRDMLLEVAEMDADGNLCVGNGDEQLGAIKTLLFNTIVADSSYDTSSFSREQIEQFCIALVAYGVSKCKILKSPED